MSSTESRLRQLINENLDLDHEPDFDRAFSDAGVTSMQAVAFFKLVNDEFDLKMVAEDCMQFDTLRDLVTHIDARAA
ncbi:MAG: acyl carrier protein [Rhodospirillales bacterium]|nr:acyl carrier protein [Rhodospirillales bacterium]MCY3854872.1 acyl carrier protein [Rhodospirillales bacterium]MCY4004703.1 acyl carrier protein [Rhodospirillales bacterium]MCY4098241.1 acyl carrier protein [Rhodospirillales bacterium]MDE0372897.1 acyl carrier protein [Rhodospirillales bacterium]